MIPCGGDTINRVVVRCPRSDRAERSVDALAPEQGLDTGIATNVSSIDVSPSTASTAPEARNAHFAVGGDVAVAIRCACCAGDHVSG